MNTDMLFDRSQQVDVELSNQSQRLSHSTYEFIQFISFWNLLDSTRVACLRVGEFTRLENQMGLNN